MRAILAVLLLSGCAGLNSSRNADESIRMVKEAGGTGCYYSRVSGNSRPYADVEVRSIVVTTLGKGTSYAECLKEIPAELKAVRVVE